MKQRLLFTSIGFCALVCLTLSFRYGTAKPPERPKLVVGIVIDQMRQEYLYRFYDKFGEGGFRRILNEGFNNKNTHYNYIPTETGPGHAAVYTGAIPAFSGIVANDWLDRDSKRMVNCVSGDTTEHTVGGTGPIGQVSAKRLLVTTIADELKIHTQNQAKVVSVAIKDRSATFSAGHRGDGAYWFDAETGHFISSSYYVKELPQWVKAFNNRGVATQFNESTWEPMASLSTYTETGPDANAYEYKMGNRTQPTFPYDIKEMTKDFEALKYRYLPYTPFGNTLVKEMAKAAVKGEQLGQDNVPDLLGVNFSSLDYAGHMFGPDSKELQDMMLRLDRDLEDLLNFLDENVGEGEYLLFISADHGGMHVPQFLIDHKLPGGYLATASVKASMNDFLADKFNLKDLVLHGNIYEVYLDRKKITEFHLDLEKVQRAAAQFLMDFEGVVYAYTATDLARNEYSDGLAEKLQNGFYYPRSPDVLAIHKPGWMGISGQIKTGHGSGYTYDTHVPLLWYGWHIPKGESSIPRKVINIAPTVAQLLSIPFPSGSTTEVVEEIFKR